MHLAAQAHDPHAGKAPQSPRCQPPHDTAATATSGAARPAREPGVPFTSHPFDVRDVAAALGPGALDRYTYAEVKSSSKLYGLLTTYIAGQAAAHSLQLAVQEKTEDIESRQDLIDSLRSGADTTASAGLTLGLGMFPFVFDAKDASDGGIDGNGGGGGNGDDAADAQAAAATPVLLWCLHQRVGAPVGTNCGASFFESLVIFADNTAAATTTTAKPATATAGEPGVAAARAVIEQLAARMLTSELTKKTGAFTVFRWHVKYGYWKKDARCLARGLDSVVLSNGVKEKIVADLDEFHEDSTLDFYIAHGIPYKRSYLFHGAPGAGKTSLIQALAGHYQKNICYMQPSHPEITDDAIKSAVQTAPKNSLIIFEDVDALFQSGFGASSASEDGGGGGSKQGRVAAKGTNVTFSGVLNALDGVGCPLGQVFVLTTNHRENLDPALIRNGRVDLHIRFTDATVSQYRQMFESFYPGDANKPHALEFAANLGKALQAEGAAKEAKRQERTQQQSAGKSRLAEEKGGASTNGVEGGGRLDAGSGLGDDAAGAAANAGAGRICNPMTVSMAALQHYFVTMRKATAAAAASAEGVQAIIDDMREKEIHG